MTPAQRMQWEIEQHNKQLLEKQKEMLNFVAPKSVGVKKSTDSVE